jgi:heme A synthase
MAKLNRSKLSRPKVITFWIAVILVAIGILAALGTIPALSAYALWMVVVGFVLLALGNFLNNL